VIDLFKLKLYLVAQWYICRSWVWAVYFNFTNLKRRHWFDRHILPDDLSIYFEWLFCVK